MRTRNFLTKTFTLALAASMMFSNIVHADNNKTLITLNIYTEEGLIEEGGKPYTTEEIYVDKGEKITFFADFLDYDEDGNFIYEEEPITYIDYNEYIVDLIDNEDYFSNNYVTYILLDCAEITSYGKELLDPYSPITLYNDTYEFDILLETRETDYDKVTNYISVIEVDGNNFYQNIDNAIKVNYLEVNEFDFTSNPLTVEEVLKRIPNNYDSSCKLFTKMNFSNLVYGKTIDENDRQDLYPEAGTYDFTSISLDDAYTYNFDKDRMNIIIYHPEDSYVPSIEEPLDNLYITLEIYFDGIFSETKSFIIPAHIGDSLDVTAIDEYNLHFEGYELVSTENLPLTVANSYDFYSARFFYEKEVHSTPSPTPTVIPSVTPIQTATPIPTQAPSVAPTASPIPTSTPLPSPVPTVEPGPIDEEEEIEYDFDIYIIIERYLDGEYLDNGYPDIRSCELGEFIDISEFEYGYAAEYWPDFFENPEGITIEKVEGLIYQFDTFEAKLDFPFIAEPKVVSNVNGNIEFYSAMDFWNGQITIDVPDEYLYDSPSPIVRIYYTTAPVENNEEELKEDNNMLRTIFIVTGISVPTALLVIFKDKWLLLFLAPKKKASPLYGIWEGLEATYSDISDNLIRKDILPEENKYLFYDREDELLVEYETNEAYIAKKPTAEDLIAFLTNSNYITYVDEDFMISVTIENGETANQYEEKLTQEALATALSLKTSTTVITIEFIYKEEIKYSFTI